MVLGFKARIWFGGILTPTLSPLRGEREDRSPVFWFCRLSHGFLSSSRVTPHSRGTAHHLRSIQITGGNHIAAKNESQTMHLLFEPVLANMYYVGGGSVGLLLVIVVVVLLLRR